MKTFTVLLLLSAFLISCGDNPVNDSGNNTNPTSDTVTLFTHDSIFAGQPYQGRDSVEYFCSVDIDTLYCNFNLYSQNVLGVNIVLTAVNVKDTVMQLNLNTNQNYSFKLPVNSSNFNAKLYFALMGATGGTYYASLRNIKLYYIKTS